MIFYATLAIVAVLPFIATANLWGWWFVASASYVLFSSALFMRLRNARDWPDAIRTYRLLLAALAATWVYLLLKVLPLPGELVSSLNPEAARLSVDTDELVGPYGWRALSVDVGLGLRGFLQFSAHFTLFLLILFVVDDVKRARRVAYLVAVVVTIHGLWGIFGRLGSGRAVGLFADPNVFAVFVEIGLALAVGIYLGVFRRRAVSGLWRGRLLATIELLMSPRVLVPGLVLILFTALFASGSRGGGLAALAALTATGLLFARPAKSRRATGYAMFLVLIVAASLAWFGGDIVLERMGQTDLSKASRPSIWHSTLRMIDDYSLVGVGADSWRFAYSRYRDPELGGYWLPTGAHNAYLQLLGEHGVLGFLLLGGVVVIGVAQLIGGLRKRHDPFIRGVLFGALAAVLSLLLHSLVEGGFQTFTTTAYFYVILALGLATARLPREESARR
ncbi:MAG: O-antigen ligase family protein [Chromatiaceae bacterium]|nr:O-antigen ligase family protein [Chromatiaceae bacterium]